ncbi:MAG TPA: FkbM family methyltransferase [Beijerinckiaceae bacterium]|nr:FkbM family methyltransferase [Beijerinckiaceae bacterium]
MPDKEPPFGAYAPTGLISRLLGATRALPPQGVSKRIGFVLRRIAILLLGGRPLDVVSFGVRFRLHPYYNVCEKRILFSPRQFDEIERDLIAQRIRPGFCFVDVGANIGGYALFVAAQAGQGARILAIEPQPEIFRRLMANIGFNPFGTVKAMDCAVADSEGEVTLFIDAENQGESSLKIITAGSRSSVRVPARRLLSILRDEGFDRLDAIKLDVEGAEDLILETFFAKAPEKLYPGLIVIERAPDRWQVDLPSLLVAKGYRLIAETRNNFVFERGFAAD